MYWRIGQRVVEEEQGGQARADLGQLQMYVNYYDRCVKAEDENPTIGILLCTEKNDTMVKLSLPADNNTILTSKYQLYLPTEQQLKDEVQKVKRLVEMRKEESDE
jgi:hypothetical protein